MADHPGFVTQGLHIRLACAADAEAVSRLCGELGYPTSVTEAAARITELARSDCDVVFVADIEGQIVGWMQVALRRFVESDTFAELVGLVVTQGMRGRGIGAALAARGEAWARDHGVPRMRVRSSVVRTAAHAFYGRMGFTLTKTQRVFDKELC